ncbi:hypothetical protein DEO72_LG9g1926 [Vigna unguiculata]|uniref:Uncharacterized protein n=1 Tax=Vigna unguiculata TaxID=3917 RepID=A0A4D6N1S1_VIGUN|nr:hypothetical protein DEO72_LG9g1926 [Vigna unguiculata]
MGKDIKRVRAALLGPGSSSGVTKPEAGLIELPETTVRHDIDINLSESLVNSIDNMKPNAMVKAMVEFSSKALILGRRVGSLCQRELKEGSGSRVEELKEELKGQADKHVEDKTSWKKEREEWMEEKNRLGSWRVRCLDSEKKLNVKIADLETDLDEMKEKHDVLESELKPEGSDNPGAYQWVPEMVEDVVEGQLVNEANSSLEEEAEETVAEEVVVDL